MDSDGAFWCVVAAILCFILGVSLGSAGAAAKMREDAVKAGVAYYSVNQDTGETKFQYKAIPVAP